MKAASMVVVSSPMMVVLPPMSVPRPVSR